MSATGWNEFFPSPFQISQDSGPVHCPIPFEVPHLRNATAEMGQFGDRQFASNSQDLQGTGYGKNEGLNIIEYGQGAAFNTVEKVVVDVSRADRGRES